MRRRRSSSQATIEPVSRARAALPEFPAAAIGAAVRRYCMVEVTGPPATPLPKSHPEIVARWDALFREGAFRREALC